MTEHVWYSSTGNTFFILPDWAYDGWLAYREYLIATGRKPSRGLIYLGEL